MSCPTCGATMVPMIFSSFCPNDCDRPSSVIVTVSSDGDMGPGFIGWELVDGETCAVFDANVDIRVPTWATYGMWRYAPGSGSTAGWHKMARVGKNDSLGNGRSIGDRFNIVARLYRQR